MTAADPPRVVEHFFRHDYARLVAMLARRVGVQHLDVIEDAVQTALTTALAGWTIESTPRDPSAWIYRAAYNEAIEELRREARRSKIIEIEAAIRPDAETPSDLGLDAHDVGDDLLRMLFVCCDDAIPHESRLVLALKTLCGFTVPEIALRLFTSEANVYKRLTRAREKLREIGFVTETPAIETLRSRLSAVHDVIYLVFNEGYLAANSDRAIRRELCDEAIRLATILAEHGVGAVPETFALLALMHFHVARFDARLDDVGGLVLLERQDRSRWDRDRIRRGAEWLARSASGDAFTRFHAEAGIAAEHCFAPSFSETRWDAIIDLYAMLERVAPSPLHMLNRALAVAELEGPTAGLAVCENMIPPSWLAGSYLWDAVLSDLHRRAGDIDRAQLHAQRACAAAPSGVVEATLRRRLELHDA